MQILIVGDLHIDEKSIPEIDTIFRKDILPIKADIVIQLGDWFEKNSPTPAELEFGTELITKLKKRYKKVIILSGTGKHDWKNQVSVVSYLKYLKVKTPGVKYELEVDNKKIFFAHWMLKQSKLEYGTGRCGIKDLSKYDFVFLGHQHIYQELKKGKIYHINSIRFQHFNEVVDSYKRVAILKDGKLTFKRLESPYPMLDVRSLEDLKKLEPGKRKVRLIISKFSDFKNWVNEINNYKHKFNQFKVKLDFDNTKKVELNKSNNLAKTKQNNLLDILRKGIAKIEDKDVKQLLEEIINEK